MTVRVMVEITHMLVSDNVTLYVAGCVVLFVNADNQQDNVYVSKNGSGPAQAV